MQEQFQQHAVHERPTLGSKKPKIQSDRVGKGMHAKSNPKRAGVSLYPVKQVLTTNLT